MQILLGLLIVCCILSVPRLRRPGLILLGVIAVVVAGLMVRSQWLKPNLSSTAGAPPALIDRQREADRIARAKSLVPTSEIEIRDLWLTALGSKLDVATIKGRIDEAGLGAVVHNESDRYTVTSLEVAADLFDCPANVTDWAKCDQIGTIRAILEAEIPPGQVRQIMSRTPWQTVANLPPITGTLKLRWAIDAVYARDP